MKLRGGLKSSHKDKRKANFIFAWPPIGPMLGVILPGRSIVMELTLINPQLSSKFRVKTNTASEVVISDITTDLNHPQEVKYGCVSVRNVTTGMNLQHPPVNQAGVRIALQCRSVLDIGTADVPEEAPITCTVTLTVPQSSAITGAVMQDHLVKTLSMLIESDAQTSLVDKLSALAKGALMPVDL